MRCSQEDAASLPSDLSFRLGEGIIDIVSADVLIVAPTASPVLHLVFILVALRLRAAAAANKAQNLQQNAGSEDSGEAASVVIREFIVLEDLFFDVGVP
mmetsp:Transcript_7409/g.10510  ORF Transcript_7409/g.10510 Transcript_7409/m.10510 type:complete len:99 (-) Transcript_7409:120-416(-)